MCRFSTGILILFAVAAVLSGCGGSTRLAEPDTSREQYEAGIRKLRQDDLKGAEQVFRGVIERNGKSPYGYAGMALLDLVRTNYDDALSYADRAIKHDAAVSDAQAVRGRVLSIRKKGKHWFEDAMASLGRALEIDPADQRALYFAAECCLDAHRYREARQYYYAAADQDGQYERIIGDRLTLVGKILEAGELSDSGSRIAPDEKIDRADLAELLVTELKIGHLVRERRADIFGQVYRADLSLAHDPDEPRDVGKNRSRDAIMEALALGIPSLDVFPDGYFYPDRLVSRARVAAVLQDALVMLRNSAILSTVYVGTESPYVDVHHEYYAFNAIMLCTGSGIMAPDVENTGCFDPDGAVSGIDAILMVRALERGLDMPVTSFYEQAGYPLQAE